MALQLADAVADRHAQRHRRRDHEHPRNAREPGAAKRNPDDRRRDADEALDSVRQLLRVLVVRERSLRLGGGRHVEVRREQALERLVNDVCRPHAPRAGMASSGPVGRISSGIQQHARRSRSHTLR